MYSSFFSLVQSFDFYFYKFIIMKVVRVQIVHVYVNMMWFLFLYREFTIYLGYGMYLDHNRCTV